MPPKPLWLRKWWGRGLDPLGQQLSPAPPCPQLTSLLLPCQGTDVEEPKGVTSEGSRPWPCPPFPSPGLRAQPQPPSRCSRIRQVPGRTCQSGRSFAQPLQSLHRGAPRPPTWHCPEKEDPGERRRHAVCLMSVWPGALPPEPRLLPHPVAGASPCFGVKAAWGWLVTCILLFTLRLGPCCLGVWEAAG